MPNKYNYIYEKLVLAEDDLVGLIAYGIYKKHKIEFITKIKEELQREPTQEECNSFSVASGTDTLLTSYRERAETMLSETVVNIAGEEVKKIESEMLKRYKEEISSCLPSKARSFGSSILAGILSTLLFTVVAGIFYFVGETSDRSTRDNVKQVMEVVQTQIGSDSILVKK